MHVHDVHCTVVQGFVKDRRTAVGRFPAACVEVLDGSADATSPGHRHQSSTAVMSPRATGSSFDFKCVGMQRTDSWLSHHMTPCDPLGSGRGYCGVWFMLFTIVTIRAPRKERG
jgi:hypothetical protein